MVNAQFSVELTTLSDLNRITITICDGCGERLDDEHEIIAVVRLVRLILHMHRNCTDLLESLLSQLPSQEYSLVN